MRHIARVVIAAAVVGAVTLPVAGASARPAGSHHKAAQACGYLRDNGGFGGDLSPAAGSSPYPGEPVSIITSSAWQWCPDFASLEIYLESAPTWCLTNNSAHAVMRPCRGNADQLWQETGGSPFHLQNIGSDYLCAEGASDAAVIPLSGCTSYRDHWGFN